MLRLAPLAALLAPQLAMAALFGSLFAGSAPGNLGARDGRLAACPAKPNCVSSQAGDDDHRIAPFAYRGEPAAAMAKLAGVVATQPGATIVTRRDDYLYATFQTPLMGFIDDVEFVAVPGRGAIDVRSASRLGYSDLGTNRKRVETLRTAFVENGT
jgi:uncharacterized protein (DUF1499 family)